MTIHLIDYLAYSMRCEISDLKSAPRTKLLYQIEKIPPEACSAEEWKQCLYYLFSQELPSADAGEAREALIGNLNAV